MLSQPVIISAAVVSLIVGMSIGVWISDGRLPPPHVLFDQLTEQLQPTAQPPYFDRLENPTADEPVTELTDPIPTTTTAPVVTPTEVSPTVRRTLTGRTCDYNDLDKEEVCCSRGEKIRYTFTGATHEPIGCYTPAADEGATCQEASDCQGGQCLVDIKAVLERVEAGSCSEETEGMTFLCPDITGSCTDGGVQGGAFLTEPNRIQWVRLQ